MGFVIVYESNNSGGSWWLNDEDWKRLEEGGWVVHWVHDINEDHGNYEGKGDKDHDPHEWESKHNFGGHSHRYANKDLQLIAGTPNGEDYIGAPAASCAKRFESGTVREAVEEWEGLSHQNASDLGCGCCGTPHSFSVDYDDGRRDYISPEISSHMPWED